MDHKTINFNKIVIEKMNLTPSKVSYFIETYFKEKKKLRNFASKITIIPETVQVYSIPNIQKESESK